MPFVQNHELFCCTCPLVHHAIQKKLFLVVGDSDEGFVGAIPFGACDVFKDHRRRKDGVIVCFLEFRFVGSVGGNFSDEAGAEFNDKEHTTLDRISIDR